MNQVLGMWSAKVPLSVWNRARLKHTGTALGKFHFGGGLLSGEGILGTTTMRYSTLHALQ